MEKKSSSPTVLFTQEMRRATRSVHDLSDHLVNLKLGVSLSDPEVWYAGLRVFAPVFEFLEKSMDKHESLRDLDIDGLRRSEAFTKDLNYHYGNDGSWQEKAESTPAVKNYIEHLKEIEGENPLILAAYIYHLYMGLLSGGQILAKKRGVKSSLGLGSFMDTEDSSGNCATMFDRPIKEIKLEMKNATNKLAENISEEERKALLAEGSKVFQLNIELIRGIEGINERFRRRLLNLFTISAIAIGIISVLWIKFSQKT